MIEMLYSFMLMKNTYFILIIGGQAIYNEDEDPITNSKNNAEGLFNGGNYMLAIMLGSKNCDPSWF